jgi:hypothetical protein
VLKAFDDLATAQRGEPETAMMRAQRALRSGVYSFVIEHTGDLTHRGWVDRHLQPDTYLSYSYVDEKVHKVLHLLRYPYGFEREHRENMVSNAGYDGVDYATYRTRVTAALDAYAEAHAALPVYNEAQLLAREAAVALGLQKPKTAQRFLEQLEVMLQDPETWERHATEYRLGPDDYPMQITGIPAWRHAAAFSRS